MDTVKVKAKTKSGYVIVNVCDIKPDHEPFSDEDAAMFPSTGGKDQKLQEVHDKNIKTLASKIADLEKENDELKSELEGASENIVELERLNKNYESALKEIDKDVDLTAIATKDTAPKNVSKASGANSKG